MHFVIIARGQAKAVHARSHDYIHHSSEMDKQESTPPPPPPPRYIRTCGASIYQWCVPN